MDVQLICYGIRSTQNFVQNYKDSWNNGEINDGISLAPNNADPQKTYSQEMIHGYWPEKWTFRYVRRNTCVEVDTQTQKYIFNQMYFRKLILCIKI